MSSGSIGDESYVSLTTYRRSGEGVATPVWCAPLADGRVGVWTNATSWKVKRLAQDPRVTLRPCDRRGRVADGAPTYAGQAQVLRSGGLFEEVLGRVRSAYGVLGWAAMTLRPTRRHDAALVITLDQANSA